MKKIRIGIWKGHIPTNFDELNYSQKLFALTAKIYLQAESCTNEVRQDIKKELVLRLLNTPKIMFSMLIAPQRVALYRHLDWVQTIKIDKKPFEHFTVGRYKYYLPQERFGNTSSIEYAMCLILFAQFGQQNSTAIFELIATLCRPARNQLKNFKASNDWNGDVREEYNTILAQERAKVFEKKLPFGIVIAIKEYYTEMLEQFINRYELLFDSADDMKPLFSNGEGCIALLEDVAEANIYGNFNAVCATPIDTVYLYLRHKKIKAEKEEEDFLNIHEER